MLPLLLHNQAPILRTMRNHMLKLILMLEEQALRRSKNRAAANAMLAMLAPILVITLCKVFFLASIPYVENLCWGFGSSCMNRLVNL